MRIGGLGIEDGVDTRMENLKAMVETVEEYGGYA